MRSPAGRLKHFFQHWEKITQDPFVLNCIRGYEIPFTSPPPQSLSFTKIIPFSMEEEKSISMEIERLIAMGAVNECKSEQGEFLSSFFLVQKSNGSKRFILNLKVLNHFIESFHFKLEDLRSTLRLISPKDFLYSLDLKVQ